MLIRRFRVLFVIVFIAILGTPVASFAQNDTITLLVRDDRTFAPLSGVVVELRDESGQRALGSFTTDTSGVIVARDLPGNAVRLRVNAPLRLDSTNTPEGDLLIWLIDPAPLGLLLTPEGALYLDPSEFAVDQSGVMPADTINAIATEVAALPTAVVATPNPTLVAAVAAGVAAGEPLITPTSGVPGAAPVIGDVETVATPVPDATAVMEQRNSLILWLGVGFFVILIGIVLASSLKGVRS